VAFSASSNIEITIFAIFITIFRYNFIWWYNNTINTFTLTILYLVSERICTLCRCLDFSFRGIFTCNTCHSTFGEASTTMWGTFLTCFFICIVIISWRSFTICCFIWLGVYYWDEIFILITFSTVIWFRTNTFSTMIITFLSNIIIWLIIKSWFWFTFFTFF